MSTGSLPDRSLSMIQYDHQTERGFYHEIVVV